MHVKKSLSSNCIANKTACKQKSASIVKLQAVWFMTTMESDQFGLEQSLARYIVLHHVFLQKNSSGPGGEIGFHPLEH